MIENVKEEPVSSTNGQESESESIDEKPTNLSVLIKEQPPTNDYVNDPEAGPSGIKCEPNRPAHTETIDQFIYPTSVYSDDSDDEALQSTVFWNRRKAWKATAPNPDVEINVQSTDSPAVEVIDLSETEPASSNDTEQSETNNNNNNNNKNSVMEILTLPDLQLDWASDSSSEDEIHTISNALPDELEFNLLRNVVQLADDLPPIDLTVSDDEEQSTEIINETVPELPRRYNGLFDEYHNAISSHRNGAGPSSFCRNPTEVNNRWNPR